MEFKPDIKRLLTTIQHEEPDRVPLAEFGIDKPILERFMGRPMRTVEDEIAFRSSAGFDFVYLRAEYEYTGTFFGAALAVPEGTTWAEESQAESISTTKDGPIATLRDIETYPWPDPQTVSVANHLRAAAALPDGMGIITGVGGIFTRTWMLLGYERFSLSLYDNPELVARVAERIGRIQCAVLRRLVKMPQVHAVWYGDDLGYTEALLASPRVLHQYLFPWIEELSRIAHGAGMPFIMHSDGNLVEILDDLVALGLNALHPIEPKAMDIYDLRRRYQRKLALFGNIDMGYTLQAGRGRPQDVRAEVREKIKALAPGGGYGLASGAGITHYVPLENFLALREALLEYGHYPIRL